MSIIVLMVTMSSVPIGPLWIAIHRDGLASCAMRGVTCKPFSSCTGSHRIRQMMHETSFGATSTKRVQRRQFATRRNGSHRAATDGIGTGTTIVMETVCHLVEMSERPMSPATRAQKENSKHGKKPMNDDASRSMPFPTRAAFVNGSSAPSSPSSGTLAT